MEKGLLLLIKPPDEQGQKTLADKKLCSIYIEITQKTFAKINLLKDIKIFPVYQKTSRYPDLRWLSPIDPGFLVQKGTDEYEQLKNAAKWALSTGINTIGVLWLDMFYINPDYITKAFEILRQKHIVIGKSKEGECYFTGFDKSCEPILEKITINDKSGICERLEYICEKSKLTVYQLPQTYKVTDEQSYHQWICDTKKLPRKLKNGLFAKEQIFC